MHGRAMHRAPNFVNNMMLSIILDSIYPGGVDRQPAYLNITGAALVYCC